MPKTNHQNPKHASQSGFTLIELLIVIAILTVLFAITIVAVNPARQFSQANNTQRRSDVSALLNAVYQYAADNRGALPAYVNSSSTQEIGSSTGSCAITCGATTTVATCLNLDPTLVPTYLAAIPYDPNQSNASSTHYAITKSTSGNRLTITACDAELSETISVTR
ncbi:MAG: prepilin-type N-terminal cleavage/methylation domain-containing protein [Patescibacteria group bacterium]|nr:prepilin-type N-terminal cleavage/methylation domain-containing protein [Patescibacteria group bacterium]